MAVSRRVVEGLRRVHARGAARMTAGFRDRCLATHFPGPGRG